MIKLATTKLILWDLDGTLINSESIHYTAGMNALHKLNLPIKDTKVLPGMDNLTCFELLTGLSLKLADNQRLFKLWENTAIDEVLDLITPDTAIIQSMELVKYFASNQINQAIVSNSNRVIIDNAIKQLNLTQYIDRSFAIEDVTKPKPHPEPYLNAMKYYQIAPSQTIVFEDSQTGITAAKAAKANLVIGIGAPTQQYQADYAFALDQTSWLSYFS